MYLVPEISKVGRDASHGSHRVITTMAVDAVVKRRDGPRRLRGHDDDDNDDDDAR